MDTGYNLIIERSEGQSKAAITLLEFMAQKTGEHGSIGFLFHTKYNDIYRLVSRIHSALGFNYTSVLSDLMDRITLGGPKKIEFDVGLRTCLYELMFKGKKAYICGMEHTEMKKKNKLAKIRWDKDRVKKKTHTDTSSSHADIIRNEISDAFSGNPRYLSGMGGTTRPMGAMEDDGHQRRMAIIEQARMRALQEERERERERDMEIRTQIQAYISMSEAFTRNVRPEVREEAGPRIQWEMHTVPPRQQEPEEEPTQDTRTLLQRLLGVPRRLF